MIDYLDLGLGPDKVWDFTNSELNAFRACKNRWGFEYAELLRPHVTGKVLGWGNMFHAGADAGFRAAFAEGVPATARLEEAIEGAQRGISAFHFQFNERLNALEAEGKVSPEEAQERFEDSQKALEVTSWAALHFFELTQRDLQELVFLGSEVPFAVPLTDSAGRLLRVNKPRALGGGSVVMRHTGKIDVCWWDPSGERLIVDDHKTTDDLFATIERRIELDPQMSGYQRALSAMAKAGKIGAGIVPENGWERIGMCRYNAVRRTQPRVPNVNKIRKNDGPHDITSALAQREQDTGVNCGLVSVAAIDTTARIYAEALREQAERGLPITEQQRTLFDRLNEQGERYFHRFEYFRTDDLIERWRQETVIDVRQMRDATYLPTLRTRNPGVCTQANSLPCTYRQVCLDDSPEMRALYRTAETKHEEI